MTFTDECLAANSILSWTTTPAIEYIQDTSSTAPLVTQTTEHDDQISLSKSVKRYCGNLIYTATLLSSTTDFPQSTLSITTSLSDPDFIDISVTPSDTSAIGTEIWQITVTLRDYLVNPTFTDIVEVESIQIDFVCPEDPPEILVTNPMINPTLIYDIASPG